MPREQVLRERFERSFGLYDDLIASFDAGRLRSTLPNLPSNPIGGQLWCVVGARESYARAVEAGAWSGFACSLDDPSDPTAVSDALVRSAGVVRGALDVAAGDAQFGLLLDLLEHEAAHQGQLIRYLYGLRLPVPDSWKARYALD